MASSMRTDDMADGSVRTNALGIMNEKDVIRSAGREVIDEFLNSHDCFEVIRQSGKVVVFDTKIPIQLAFYALVEHDMQAAPLWDASTREFVGLMTITDFISILQYYSQQKIKMSELASRSISDVLANPTQHGQLKHRGFVGAHPSATLMQCCKLMHSNNIDYLPVILPADARVLSIITYTTILEFLVTNFREQRRLFDDTIFALGIGTYKDIVTVTQFMVLSDVLTLMNDHNLSAVPVVDASHRVVSMYSRSDITFLAAATDADSAVRNLSLTLGEVLDQQRTDVSTPDRLFTCSPYQTLQSVFEMFATVKFNRMVCVDDEGRCVGIVSARDIVAYFL